MNEQSHGKPRLTKPRLSDMGDAPSPEHVEQRREQLRENARNRVTKEAVKAPLRALAGDEVRKALAGKGTPEESRLVAENALSLASDAQREIGSQSPFVSFYSARYGVNAALAGYYTQKAAEIGLDSPQGIALIEAAHRCEARAERAMVASDAAVKAFASKKPKAIDAHAEVMKAFGDKT